jgi:predicted glutamine amidotransferase
MCRLFGLHAGVPVSATFWLLDAPDSLQQQSHREPDGAGIGVFDAAGDPVVDKQPIAAWQDRRFATEARTLTSSTFVAHVRYASTGNRTSANTHPFVQDGRIFAHNGAFTEVARLDDRLAALDAAGLVRGQTDSERMFALITAETRANGGDVDAGISAALNWLAESVPVFSLNFLLASADTMWVLRYPDTHGLYLLRRDPGGHLGRNPLHAHSSRIHAESPALSERSASVIASEPMDSDDWRSLDPGELLRIDADLSLTTSHPLPAEPRRRLSLAALDPAAAASQQP